MITVEFHVCDGIEGMELGLWNLLNGEWYIYNIHGKSSIKRSSIHCFMQITFLQHKTLI